MAETEKKLELRISWTMNYNINEVSWVMTYTINEIS